MKLRLHRLGDFHAECRERALLLPGNHLDETFFLEFFKRGVNGCLRCAREPDEVGHAKRSFGEQSVEECLLARIERGRRVRAGLRLGVRLLVSVNNWLHNLGRYLLQVRLGRHLRICGDNLGNIPLLWVVWGYRLLHGLLHGLHGLDGAGIDSLGDELLFLRRVFADGEFLMSSLFVISCNCLVVLAVGNTGTQVAVRVVA